MYEGVFDTIFCGLYDCKLRFDTSLTLYLSRQIAQVRSVTSSSVSEVQNTISSVCHRSVSISDRSCCMLGIERSSGGSLVTTKGLGLGGGDRVLLSLLFGGVLEKFLLSSERGAIASGFLWEGRPMELEVVSLLSM